MSDPCSDAAGHQPGRALVSLACRHAAACDDAPAWHRTCALRVQARARASSARERGSGADYDGRLDLAQLRVEDPARGSLWWQHLLWWQNYRRFLAPHSTEWNWTTKSDGG